MTLAENLKKLRRGSGLSQEQLAEKLGVSRQAITKWESGTGVPELENLIALSDFFGLSIDALLDQGRENYKKETGYTSTTEYDIDGLKHFDLHLGSAKEIALVGNEGEKLRIVLSSPSYDTLERDFKLKIDENGRRLDLRLIRGEDVPQSAVLSELSIRAEVPNCYLEDLELVAKAGKILLDRLQGEEIELDIHCPVLEMNGVEAKVSVNCAQDMDLLSRESTGQLSINQISCASTLRLPEGTVFQCAQKGIGNRILMQAEKGAGLPVSTPDAPLRISLNGARNELTILSFSAQR